MSIRSKRPTGSGVRRRRISLLSFCSYPSAVFIWRFLNQSFYWNIIPIFSTSFFIVPRKCNGLSVHGGNGNMLKKKTTAKLKDKQTSIATMPNVCHPNPVNFHFTLPLSLNSRLRQVLLAVKNFMCWCPWRFYPLCFSNSPKDWFPMVFFHGPRHHHANSMRKMRMQSTPMPRHCPKYPDFIKLLCCFLVNPLKKIAIYIFPRLNF